MDVKIEGKNVQLLSDPMLQQLRQQRQPAQRGDDAGRHAGERKGDAVWKGNCPICGKDHETLEETEKTRPTWVRWRKISG